MPFIKFTKNPSSSSINSTLLISFPLLHSRRPSHLLLRSTHGRRPSHRIKIRNRGV
ncbi:hypothetical protein EZV62_025652 [Acer yangbiense]|uniref:Uncharacterized protein n=1 Tax=Acer yangbiense TaxID=1000413 RepID=A0A5C7GZ32_9ROSI|nr:hypothetical protein EZV62_025652 [Acer yangbiense]